VIKNDKNIMQARLHDDGQSHTCHSKKLADFLNYRIFLKYRVFNNKGG